MDSRLLHYYNRELQFMREMGAEFAQEFPKIAGRLGLDGFDCADPYVERLLEGFAFLAARVQLKIDAEFPRFTQHLFECVYPSYLAPTPSMAVMEFQPNLSEADLAAGLRIPRDSSLRSLLGKGDQTVCTYRTAHEVTLWPVKIAEAEYVSRNLSSLHVPELTGVKSAVRLRLEATAGLTFQRIALDSLQLFLRSGEQAVRLYEHFVADAVAVVVQPVGRPPAWRHVITPPVVHKIGFEPGQALLPSGPRSYQGYRLLSEYFAFPERFLFVELDNLFGGLRRCTQPLVDVIVLFNRADLNLEGLVSTDNFALFCTPAINLFPKRADRIHLGQRSTEHHVVPDRTRPMDFEVYAVTEVTGHGVGAEQERQFEPLYSYRDAPGKLRESAYYTVHRQPRLSSDRQRRRGARSSYLGSEVYVSIVDMHESPYPIELKQLGVITLCTNRDLPLHMPIGQTNTDFTMEQSAPVQAVRCVAGPTRPRPAVEGGDITWRLISHLSLNYLSLVDADERQGASALRELLALYGDAAEPAVRKQIEGVRTVAAESIVRRIPTAGPITYGRGTRITLTLDDAAFEGLGSFLLGAVLEDFFARYVSINSFTETVVRTVDRGEVVQWPARTGRRHVI